jgi:hypothetical protein
MYTLAEYSEQRDSCDRARRKLAGFSAVLALVTAEPPRRREAEAHAESQPWVPPPPHPAPPPPRPAPPPLPKSRRSGRARRSHRNYDVTAARAAAHRRASSTAAHRRVDAPAKGRRMASAYARATRCRSARRRTQRAEGHGWATGGGGEPARGRRGAASSGERAEEGGRIGEVCRCDSFGTRAGSRRGSAPHRTAPHRTAPHRRQPQRGRPARPARQRARAPVRDDERVVRQRRSYARAVEAELVRGASARPRGRG